MKHRPTRLLHACALSLAVAGCTMPTDEDRARAAEESAKESLVAIDHGALEQKVDPEVVKKVQEQLIALNEYMGPANGKLDQVTVNAFEAFQRSNDLHPDGMFTQKTLRLLDEAAAKRGAGTAAAKAG